MRLVIFDIDGTILDSVSIDDKCYIQTFMDLYHINLTNIEWSDFKNVTDSGLTNDIFEQQLNRAPSTEEITSFKSHYWGLLKLEIDAISEIGYALSFIKMLSNNPNYEIGFATGGWKETAELKCSSIGFTVNEHIFRSSSDHFERSKIIEMVIDEALIKNSVEQFEKVVYIGDGVWDYKASQKLGIEFIGMDFQGNQNLCNVGVTDVIIDYTDPESILKLIDNRSELKI